MRHVVLTPWGFVVKLLLTVLIDTKDEKITLSVPDSK